MKKAARMLLAFSLAAALGFLTACSPDPAPDGHLPDETADAPSSDTAENSDLPIEEPLSAEPEPILLKAEPYGGQFITGCEGEANNDAGIELEFTVKIERTQYRRGETVSLRTSARNIGSTFRYVPSYGVPEPWLEHTDYVNGTSDLEGYGKYSIYRPPYPIPEDIPQPELCETGDTWNQSVEITIPSGAPTGMYDILIYSHGYTTIVKNAIEIVR